MTVAGHVAHAADSVDWFIEGAFGEGWDMDFDGLIAKAKAVTSLEEAVAWFDRAFAHAVEVVGAASDETLYEPIPDTRIMQGAPDRGRFGDHRSHRAPPGIPGGLCTPAGQGAAHALRLMRVS